MNKNKADISTTSFKNIVNDIQPPVADIKPRTFVLHDDTIVDNYYWMNDYFKKGPDSAKVVNYLKEENEYIEKVMAPTKNFQDILFHEMKNRIKEEDESVPVFDNGYYYYTRSEEGRQYFKYCRKKGNLDAPEEILLDVDEMAIGHPYYSAAGFSVSPDNKLLAYGVDTVSRREYIIHIKNLETGELLKDQIVRTTGEAVWANDSKTFFYTEKNPETLLTEKIRKHILGQDNALDEIVYHETDSTNYIGVSKTRSEKYILITSRATMSSEVRYLEADSPQSPFKIFQPRMKDVLYNITHQGNRFLIRTNQDAINFKLMETPLDNTDRSGWKEIIPHRPDVLLEGVDAFRDFLAITERKNGLLHIQVRNLLDNSGYFLDFGEPAYATSITSNPDYDTKTLRYYYTSLTTPASIFDFDMITKQKQLMKQTEVLGGFHSTDYTTERLYATAKDGVKVPVSLVYKKGFEKNGKAPLLLYGYGSYGHSMDAAFSSARLSLLNRGFVFAIAHIRGGQEMGRQWYEDGKMMKKINTFTDFIDSAEYLIEQEYTSKEHLYAMGGSAGGLLMGTVVNMRPDLWHGIVAQVPFVDVINTMLDESIPLTTNEFDEWGNPKNKEAYLYMKSYSPYDNVRPQHYPHMLVTTGLHDSQVQYFEPAKWVAKLRTMKTDDHLLLFKTEMEYGHGGASGRFDYLKNISLEYAFLFMLEGIHE
jgi:oligopeptidase B